MYLGIWNHGVLGDSAIYDRSTLKINIENGTWLGATVPDLMIANLAVRPYLVGDCSFQLSVNVMNICTEREKNTNPIRRIWDKVASTTRKQVECAFGMLKQRFPVLKEGVRLHHKDEIVTLIFSCCVLHNWSIDGGDYEEVFLPPDEDGDENDAVVASETQAGRKQSDALL